MITGDIIKAGLLGTDKYMPEPSGVLQDTGRKIKEQPGAKEDHFLKMAAAALLFEEAGAMPLPVDMSMPECPEEIKEVTGEKETEMIRAALAGKEEVLFRYLFFLVQSRNRVLAPQLIPDILNKALEQKSRAMNLVAACGETGKWLCALNESWASLSDESTEDNVWETGHFESRKQYLYRLRETDPAAAVALLAPALAQENAANRLAFLEQLGDTLSLADEPFLQSLLKDKSQKVKETALEYLRHIQGSAINSMYLDHIVQLIRIEEERRLLITKKKVLVIQDNIAPADALFATGIDKVSADKGVADHIYIAGQLLACIDPVVLAQRMGTTPSALIGLFLQHKEIKSLLPFLVRAAVAHTCRDWALALLQQPETQDIRLLEVLDEQERSAFYEQFLEGDIQALLAYILDPAYTIMPASLATKLLEQLGKHPYNITQPVYQRLALHLPDAAAGRLKAYADDAREDYQSRYFKAQAVEMLRIMDLKKLAI